MKKGSYHNVRGLAPFSFVPLIIWGERNVLQLDDMLDIYQGSSMVGGSIKIYIPWLSVFSLHCGIDKFMYWNVIHKTYVQRSVCETLWWLDWYSAQPFVKMGYLRHSVVCEFAQMLVTLHTVGVYGSIWLIVLIDRYFLCYLQDKPLYLQTPIWKNMIASKWDLALI